MTRQITHCWHKALLALLSSTAVMAVQAAPVTINFSADFGLDLSHAIGGTTLGQLIDTTYGPGTGTNSSVAVSGSFTFDNATAAYQQLHSGNESAANYLDPITGASLNFWGTTFTSNIPGFSGGIPFVQTEVSSSTGCLGLSNSCQGTATSNAALVANDIQVKVLDVNGTQQFYSRDSIFFYLGYATTTSAFIDSFVPHVYDDASSNELSIWGMAFSVVGKPGKDLWSSAALPADASFFDPANIDYISLQLALVGQPNGDPAQAFAVPLVGTTSSFSVTTPDPSGSNSVPEPSSLALFLSSGALLTMVGRRKRHLDQRKT